MNLKKSVIALSVALCCQAGMVYAATPAAPSIDTKAMAQATTDWSKSLEGMSKVFDPKMMDGFMRTTSSANTSTTTWPA